jgi:hypothetical protein
MHVFVYMSYSMNQKVHFDYNSDQKVQGDHINYKVIIKKC